MQKRYWYAIVEKLDDPKDYGTYDYWKAKIMLKSQGHGFIAVINKDMDYQEGFIKFEDIF